MTVEVISYMLSTGDFVKRLQFQLILQCAPFFKGIKVACVTNMEKRACAGLEQVFGGTGIEYKVLAETEEKCLLFLFRRKVLSDYLLRAEVREFLELYEYETESVDQILDRLSERVCRYICKDFGFPHEIGAFLDYPIDDVECFIEKGGKNSLFTGYWKVYNNPRRAQMTFLAYDKAKESAVNEFLTGKTIREIVCA